PGRTSLPPPAAFRWTAPILGQDPSVMRRALRMAFDWLPARPAMRPRSRSFHGRASPLAVYWRRNSTVGASLTPFNQRRNMERQAEIDERRRQFASAPGVAPSDEDLLSYL